jgi:hypothetical protein
VIEVADAVHRAGGARRAAGAAGALVERFAGAGTGGALPALPAGGAPPAEWVESLVSRLDAVAACAVVEHLFGVLPLLAACFEIHQGPESRESRGALAGVAAGRRLGALGLFTPAPAPGWGAAAVDAEPAAGGWRLHGEVRVASPLADGSLVLARRAGEEPRLAWVDHAGAGIEVRAARRGAAAGTAGTAGAAAPVADGGPIWLALQGVVVASEQLSRPLTLSPGGELHGLLAAYAGVWAHAAALCAVAGARALRRAARTTLHRGTAFSASQPVALGITEVEIEADLTVAATRQFHAAGGADDRRSVSGLLLAVAAARALAAVAATAAELRDGMGLVLEGPFAGDGAARSLTAALGGGPVLESEAARALGAPDGPLAAETVR